MDVKLNVQRFDPEATDPKPYWQEFTVSIEDNGTVLDALIKVCLLYTSPSPRDGLLSRMPSSA